MAKAKSTIPAHLEERYNLLIASNPQIVRKGKTAPYTSMNGNMFTFLTHAGVMGMRLSQADRSAFIAKHNGNLIISHNTVMKEYVEIPDVLWRDMPLLKSYLQMSYVYVASLKPKATKRKPAKK